MTKHWIKLEYSRVFAARKLLAALHQEEGYREDYVAIAEIILSAQVFDESPITEMASKTLSFPKYKSGKPTIILGYSTDYLDSNGEDTISDDIGEQVFEAIAEGTLPRTASEMETFTRSPY